MLEDELTVEKIHLRFAYWREFPPAHLLLRAIAIGLGAFKPREETDARAQENAIAKLRALFPDGRI